MKLELSNGLDHVYQWDGDITATITEPEDVKEVHFRWGSRAVSLAVTDQTVKIPVELMQLPQDIVCWAYTPDHTMDMAKIPLYQRAKPDDYAYTPTEIKTWESLDERIKALEDGAGLDVTGAAVGQIVKISAVDGDGVPTAWSPVDMPSGGVQSDYEQDDETQQDYIKNRPFWSTKTTRLRNTYEDWEAISHDSVSFVVEGKLYADIKPHFYDSGFTLVYNLPTDDNTIYQVTSRIGPHMFYVVCYRKEDATKVENWSIYPIEENEEFHQIPRKYSPATYLVSIVYGDPETLSIGYDEVYDIIEHGGAIALFDGYYNYSLVYKVKNIRGDNGEPYYYIEFTGVAYERRFDSNGVGIKYYKVYVNACKNGEGSIEWDANNDTPVGVVYPDGYESPFPSLTLTSSTAKSTKKFKITVDDTGTLTATEITTT